MTITTKDAVKFLESGLWSSLAMSGFKRKGRKAFRSFGDIEQRIELKNVETSSSGCPAFRVYAGLTSTEFLQRISTDFRGDLDTYDIFFLEAVMLGGPAHQEPQRVCDHQDARAALDVLRVDLNDWLLPFLDACKNVDGIISKVKSNLAFHGRDAICESVIRVLNGSSEKRSWMRSLDENLRVAGLEPSDFKAGIRIRQKED